MVINGIRVRHQAVCQRRCWALKGVDCEIEGGGLLDSTLVGERNECQRGRWVQKGVDCERNECQRRRWVSKGVDCEIPHWLKRGKKHSL